MMRFVMVAALCVLAVPACGPERDIEEIDDDDSRGGDDPIGFDPASGEGEGEGEAVPAGWICDAAWYDDDRCDCGCGAPDPDCPATGVCADPQPDEPDGPGSNWICDESWWGDDFCDCDCGEDDVTDCGAGECGGAGGEAPDGWTCDATWYGDDLCDCDCGIDDVDCFSGECDGGGLAVPDGWTCDADAYGDFFCDCDCGVADADCDVDECVPGPEGWTCDGSWWSDDLCDCDCGIADVDDCVVGECNDPPPVEDGLARGEPCASSGTELCQASLRCISDVCVDATCHEAFDVFPGETTASSLEGVFGDNSSGCALSASATHGLVARYVADAAYSAVRVTLARDAGSSDIGLWQQRGCGESTVSGQCLAGEGALEITNVALADELYFIVRSVGAADFRVGLETLP